ncbi:unnamed protein product [Urochloa humidicola]
MSSAEDKIDTLLKEVKNLTIGQLKITETVEELRQRTVNTDKLSVDLSGEIRNLTSRLEMLETVSKSTTPQAPSHEEGGRANGHSNATTHQGTSVGVPSTQKTLVKGEHQHFQTSNFAVDNPETSTRHRETSKFQYEYKLPKLDFPIFTGEHPRIWKEQCEKYFSMFRVPVHLWAPYATINFRDNAAQWLLSYEAQHPIESWPKLCVAVEQKFGRDLYQNYMRDLLAIKQITNVLDYADRFEKAKHRVLAHNKNLDEVFLVQKFLAGLKYDISNAIVLHKPRTVDAALSLALMQEEVLEASSKRYQPRSTREFSKYSKHQPSSAGTSTTTAAEDKSGNDNRPKWESKFSALRAQRKAQGLCMKCGEKWHKQHKCPKQIPLHVLEEFLDVLNLEEQQDGHFTDCSDEELLSLSLAATEGVQGKKTIRLQGLIQSQEILLLVDSGSSSTFISPHIVQKLALHNEQAPQVMVTIANGDKLPSDQIVPKVTWWTQGHTFSTSARVLPLQHYDMILGMDWLESHSPMWVHWRRKKLRFTHKGSRITLTGVKDCTDQCPQLKLRKLKGLIRNGGISHIIQLAQINQDTPSSGPPAVIQDLVQQHDNLFQEPKGLPPQRDLDHQITILPGVKPVNLKPYRYSPTQKDEIER